MHQRSFRHVFLDLCIPNKSAICWHVVRYYETAMKMMGVIQSVTTSVYINTENSLFVLIDSPTKPITGLSHLTGLNYQSLQ